MNPKAASIPLDEAVLSARGELARLEVHAPACLFLMATGVGLLPDRLEHDRTIALADVAGVPPPWRRSSLLQGRLGPLDAWFLEDISTDPGAPGEHPWAAGFPVWLAAACGAQLMVHTSAGAALDAEGGLRLGSFALIRDHLNLSGATPLLGLGESALGPLFPDQTRLHHEGMRAAALERARDLGLPAAEAVVACTAGPALETPAERRLYARAGADVCVQGLAAPLLAAAHAGLYVLAITAITDAGDGPARLRELVVTAGAAEPALEDLLVALADDLQPLAKRLAEEER